MPEQDGNNMPAVATTEYDPYDPRDFRSMSSGPASSPAPQGTTPGDEGETAEADPGVFREPLPEFDPKYMTPFEGLMFIGALTKTFYWMGHKFKIRTITQQELLEVAMLHQPYAGTMGELKAYESAIVAGCCMEVDDKPMPLPITNEVGDTLLATRFNYINHHWFPPLIDVIYEQYLLLEATVTAVLEQMDAAAPFGQTA